MVEANSIVVTCLSFRVRLPRLEVLLLVFNRHKARGKSLNLSPLQALLYLVLNEFSQNTKDRVVLGVMGQNTYTVLYQVPLI